MKFLLWVFLFSSLFARGPELFLLNKYSEDMNVTSWYMSEKLDGVRAYWDGERLISRSGKVFSAPAFFTKEFPGHKLDGELWSKRGDFSNISSIVNRKNPHAKWSELTYNIFEVPNAEGNLPQRLKNVQNSKYIKLIEQIKVKDKKHLDEFLKNVVEITNLLRNNGISCEFDVMGRSLSKQLKYVDKLNIPFTLIIGKREIENNSVKIRDMKSGKEYLVKISEVVNWLKPRL